MAVPSVFFLLFGLFGFVQPAQATFSTNTQIASSQGFLQGEFAEVGVRANGAFGSTTVPSGFHQNAGNCLGFRVDRQSDGWGTTVDDGDFFCPGSPFEGWQMNVGGSIAKNDHTQTGLVGSVTNAETAGSSQCVTWTSSSSYNGVSVSQRYCVPTAGQALHTDVTLTNTTGSSISDIYFGRGFDPDNATGNGSMTCNSATVNTSVYGSCNAVTGQGSEAQATARWGNGAFIALQSFDSRARVARQTGGFSSPDPSSIWTAGDTSASSGTYRGDVGEFFADAGLYVALKVPTLGAGSSTSFRISYVLSAESNNAPVVSAPIISGVGQNSAHVYTTINPKGFSTAVSLVYSTSSSFSGATTVSLGTVTGSDEVVVEDDISGLDDSTTYYVKVVAENEKGTTESTVLDFGTLSASAPVVSSEEPTVTSSDGPITLNGTINPSGLSSSATFEYSTTPDFSGTVVEIPVSGTFTGTDDVSISTSVSGLDPSTTYYFRVKVVNSSGTAYGSTVSFVPEDIPLPTSLVVTSLDDDTTEGTLRWAITQANATSGGMYDAITFSVTGTIVLTSALPQITESVTITGNGRTNTVISGDDAYRIFRVASGRTLTVSDMTLKQGQMTDGGLIYNTQGTVVADNIRFTDLDGGSAVFNANGGSTATYTDSTFDHLGTGISADWGSTPQLPSGITTWSGEDDSAFGNKTYVDNCVFENNGAAINSERFTKVEDSTFNDNTYAVAVNGLNRTQVLNSSFDGNGIAVYHSSWIPASFNMGTDNRLIDGNTFTNNGTAVYLDDGYNDGHKNPGWSTVTDNTWDGNGVWVRYYMWNEGDNQMFTLDADETTDDFVHLRNSIDSSSSTTTTTTEVPAETTSTTTTTIESPTTTTTEASVIVVPVTTVSPTTVPEESTTSTTLVIPTETTVSTTPPSTTVQTTVPKPVETTIKPSPEPTPETTVVPTTVPVIEIPVDATPEEVVAAITEVISDKSPEEVVAILETVLADGATPEEVAAITEAVLADGVTEEAVAVLLGVIDSGKIDESQVQDIVEEITKEEISPEVATALATSATVLENISGDQASQIFSSVDASSLSEEAGAAIVEAITSAPTEVKEAFEEEINIFAGVFDDYQPLGSTINVGQRRTVIAVNLVASTVGVASAAGGLPTPGSKSSGVKQDVAARKEDEEEEEGGSIEGEGPEWIKRISIYKYENGVKVMDWKNFVKKFAYGVMASGFTLAGATVMYFTLSGLTQQIALWGTVIAFACAMYLHMAEPDE